MVLIICNKQVANYQISGHFNLVHRTLSKNLNLEIRMHVSVVMRMLKYGKMRLCKCVC